MSPLFSFIWPLDRILSGATTTNRRGPENNSNEKERPILQSSNIIAAPPSDFLCQCQDTRWRSLNPRQRCSWCILLPQPSEPTYKGVSYFIYTYIYNLCYLLIRKYEKLKKVKFLKSQCEMILFTNPSARAGYDTRSIFKRSLTGLNSEFSFF